MKFKSTGGNIMDCKEKDIKNLIERVKRKEIGALIELRNMFEKFTMKKYKDIIEETYGNQYFDEYISKVEECVLKAIDSFEGSDRDNFCSYINKCITNLTQRFLRDYIKYKYKVLSFNDNLGIIVISSHLLQDENVEEIVVNEIVRKDILYKYILSGLSTAERGAILRRIEGVETIEEYAKRINCAVNTIRARESKAIKKMRQRAAAKNLKELYHLY